MSHSNTALHQLLKPVLRHEFEPLARRHHQGQKLRSASRWDQFVAMLTSQLAGRQSLRDIEASQHSQRSKLYHLGAKPIAKSTLARLNEQQPYELFQALFGQLLKTCQSRPGGHKFRFKNALYSLDASLIDLSLNLFPWADCNRTKAAVKLHVGLNHRGLIPEFVALGDGRDSDLSQGRRFDFPRGSIVVFDKGYVDYGWYKSLTDKGVFFVTRLRPNSVYQVLERREFTPDTGVTRDDSIQLNSQHALKRGAPRLRRVGFRDATTGKDYVFLTNNFQLAPRTIAAIYKDRWQVELFFKTIKQNLKIKAFVGNSRNAVLTQIWIAMCAYVLLAYLKFSCRLDWSVQRLMRVLQISLFERRSLIELVKPPPMPDKKNEPQMGLGL